MFVAPFATERHESLVQLDARVEKRFKIGRAKLAASLDVFNLTNANTVLSRQTRQNITTANNVLEILAPRVVRFGVRFSF